MIELDAAKRAILRDIVLLTTAGFDAGVTLKDVLDDDGPETIAFMASVLRGEDEPEDPAERPAGQPLTLDSISLDELRALAEKAFQDPASVTLNGIRLLAEYVRAQD